MNDTFVAAPPARDEPEVLTLWTYRYWSRVYRQWVTLDCFASSPEQALRRAQRFLRRENRRLRRARIPWRVPVPDHVNHMRLG